jgi:hypothetical protein
MRKMDLAAVITRATDLLWCIAMMDVEGTFTGRSELLEQLRTLELRGRRLNESDLYSSVIRVQEGKGNRIV